MLAALMASIHKTETRGDQVLEVLAACCLPQLLGHPQQMKNKIRIKLSQVFEIPNFYLKLKNIQCSEYKVERSTELQIRSMKINTTCIIS